MKKQKQIKFITVSVACIVLTLLISFAVFYIVNITPHYKGGYTIKDYDFEIIEFGSDNKYEAIENYWDAYLIAKKEISERFPDGIFNKNRFNFSNLSENRCDVYYDTQSDTWLVCAYPQSLSKYIVTFGGAYYCIVSSNGEVLACWGTG